LGEVSSELLSGCLRPLVSRVIRTGNGPSALVGWVRSQMTDLKPRYDRIALVGELTNRLVQNFLPISSSLKQTVPEVQR
jgi:hypothetical protein